MPANSNRVPSGLGLRPARMHEVFVSVSFPSSCFILFLFCPLWPFFALLRVAVLSSPPFRVYACTTDVPGAISQQVIRDRVVHVVIVPLPLRAGTAVHALFCFLRGVMLLGKAARLSMSLRLREWKFSLCCFSSLRVVVQEASLCRRIFTESDSRLKSQTVSRVDARKTPINSKPLRRCWFGQRVEGGGKDAVTTLAV